MSESTKDAAADGPLEQPYFSKTKDELLREMRDIQRELHERAVGCYRGMRPADTTRYRSDEAPREGCTLVIHLEKSKWCLDVYAPGYAPNGRDGMIAAYPRRPYGSTGTAIDFLIEHGFNLRRTNKEMTNEEAAYHLRNNVGDTEESDNEERKWANFDRIARM